MLTQVLALPKLNLQYLTFHDYLLRNFNLFRLESTYEIRQDVEDVALRLRYSIYSIYLSYWYKVQTLTLRARLQPAPRQLPHHLPGLVQVLTLLALLVQKHAY